MENLKKTLKKMEQAIKRMDVARFFSMLREYITKHPMYPELSDEIEMTSSNYRMMLRCFESSAEDSYRKSVFLDVQRFMKRCYLNVQLNGLILNSPVLMAARKRAEKLNFTDIQDKLRGVESDCDLFNTVFSSVLVSWIWTDKTLDIFLDIFNDSSIDIKVKQLILSAATLSCLICFDYNKFRFLCRIYSTSTEVCLKERALVGWVLTSTYACTASEDRIWRVVYDLLQDEGTRNELVALQKQIIYCMDAEKEGKIVDKDIVTNLKLSGFKNALDDDLGDSSLAEIIHPEVEEEKAEKLEQSVLKMAKMEKAGSDVYFHGFSHMKNFAFFHSLYNWFMPYYANNPFLDRVAKALDGDETFLKSLDSSPFCESDKYSFAFGIELTLGASSDFKSLIKENVLFAGRPLVNEGVDDATLVRRMYLQDLYRFFRVSSFRTSFFNPFGVDFEGDARCFFLNHWGYSHVDGCDRNIITEMQLRICRFLVKRKDYKRLDFFASIQEVENCFEMAYYKALSLIYGSKNYTEAAIVVTMMATMRPKDEKILKLTAKCYAELGIYGKAVNLYEKLLEQKPSDGIRLKLAACYLKCNEDEKAMEILHELYFRFPEQQDVLRLLAWGYAMRKEYDKAIDTYLKLRDLTTQSNQKQNVEDIYNIGICYWLKRNVEKARECFVKYARLKTDDDKELSDRFDEDEEFLQQRGVEKMDSYLMQDVVRNVLNQK